MVVQAGVALAAAGVVPPGAAALVAGVVSVVALVAPPWTWALPSECGRCRDTEPRAG